MGVLEGVVVSYERGTPVPELVPTRSYGHLDNLSERECVCACLCVCVCEGESEIAKERV